PNNWGSDWDPVGTQSLVMTDLLSATQSACTGVTSPSSTPAPVLPDPNPMLAPTLDPPIVGNNTVTAHGLYNGALLQVFDHGSTLLGQGYATGADNWQMVTPITPAMLITARQGFCSDISPPQTQPMVPVNSIPAPTLLEPICPNQPNAVVRNSTINATLVLLRNGGVAGYGGAAPGDVPIDIAPPQQFQTGDHVQVVQYIGSLVGAPSNTVVVNCASQNVVTQHNDNARDGAQLHETALTPTTVSSPNFGLLATRHVIGTILAQPLYVHGVRTSQGIKNVIFIATAEDIVYAFDADDHSADVTVPVTYQSDANVQTTDQESTKYLWRTKIGTPEVPGVPKPICSETVPPIVGVTSTPVIDVGAATMYVVARNQDPTSGTVSDSLYAIDIENGTPLRNVTVGGTDAATGITFDPTVQRQRPGLLLLDGNVYLGYGTYSCDQGAYHGWVFGYQTPGLAPAGVFTTAQSGSETGVGIWQSGNGLAGTNDGSIFFETANEVPANAPLSKLGDSFVKLSTANNSLALAAFYNPAIRNNYEAGDTDLGSGGPLILPSGTLIGGGKDGALYVLSQSNLTPTQPMFQAFYNTFHVGPTPYPYGTPAVYNTPCPPQSVYGVADIGIPCFIAVSQYQMGESFSPNIHTGPVIWQDTATHAYIYKMSEKDYLKSFDYDTSSGTVGTTPAHVAEERPLTDGMPGGFSSISANGRQNGIIWTVVPQENSMLGDEHPALLYANDAESLAVLWTNADSQTVLAKFNAPTVADGYVILPSEKLFQIYGLSFTFIPPIWQLPPVEGIHIKWLNFGGATGMLGRPITGIVLDPPNGAHQDFVTTIRGGGYGQVSVAANVRIETPTELRHVAAPPVEVVSSIYAAPRIGPHIVRGEVRRLFLQLGGVKTLGFPLTDEIPSPDGFGRMTRFEHGTITWHRGQSAKLAPEVSAPRP
ncbi:MAG: hypothetical protein JO113_03320, partial [Candidatus Eremiobacteraeota bacterium]|nr:hypothetical protein [Candidatus Eremiobacteraeota bacterium]